jgi:hypothetical protein
MKSRTKKRQAKLRSMSAGCIISLAQSIRRRSITGGNETAHTKTKFGLLSLALARTGASLIILTIKLAIAPYHQRTAVITHNHPAAFIIIMCVRVYMHEMRMYVVHTLTQHRIVPRWVRASVNRISSAPPRHPFICIVFVAAAARNFIICVAYYV